MTNIDSEMSDDEIADRMVAVDARVGKLSMRALKHLSPNFAELFNKGEPIPLSVMELVALCVNFHEAMLREQMADLELLRVKFSMDEDEIAKEPK